MLVGLAHSAAGVQPDRSHLSTDPQVRKARALIESGKPREALGLLRPIAPDHPDSTDVRFLVAIAAIAACADAPTETERDALLGEAIAALRAILVDRPGLVRVRLELARAFFLKGDDALSRGHFERVLAGKPIPAIAANVRRFLGAIQARRRWSGYFGVALAPDTNITSASSARTVRIFGLPFRFSESRVNSGVGLSVWGGGQYRYPLTPGVRLRAGADLSRREYSGREFDQTFAEGHVGPDFLSGRATEFSLLAVARRFWYGGVPYSDALGARFETEHRFGPLLRGSARVSWLEREYRRNGNSLDGPLVNLSLAATRLITSTVHGEVRGGISYEHPTAIFRRNFSPWARLGASFALPWGWSVGGSAELRWTRYKDRWSPSVPGDPARRDRSRILRLSVFNRGLTLFGFSPQLVLINEVRKSSAQLYDYRRNRAELRFVRQF